ncbi:hypothetical protein [Thauera humireducens]|uniref:hypothetical protein n=1 Tax=Thauera humireducens TaxID=1134435 RepID=UPI00312003FC
MVPSNPQELLEELDATQERYVKKKLALGGYADWQRRVVEHWLSERTVTRQEAEMRSKAFWTRMRVGIAAAGLLVPLIWHFLKIS